MSEGDVKALVALILVIIEFIIISKPNEKSLVASTVQETMAKLGEIFRSNVGYNPTHGVGSNTSHPLLTRKFKGMKNLDPGEKQQKALPVCVYCELHRLAKISPPSCSPLDSAVAWLQTMAFFWCMRSCEYSLYPAFAM